ncbi:hypothetical protein [Risungbinella massiliensis]|uniref:hypothetical protein n=1 Tax=Risungbinella massiliensis TaxID=1329796 RepID=UPI0005CC4D3B|nr:hypothetical protein [Risungbinella massiliensis]
MTLANNYYQFSFDKRLQLPIPKLYCEYEKMPLEVQADFELGCQKVASQIPEQIKRCEILYMDKFQLLQEAADLDGFDTLIEAMNEISSQIFDLNLLYQTIQGEYLGANVHG